MPNVAFKGCAKPSNRRGCTCRLADHRALAERMGHAERFRYVSVEDIWNEIRRVWPEGAGITYVRLESGGLQWPCRSESEPGTRILYTAAFGGFARAALRRIEYRPTPEQVSDDYPMLLSTGRTLYQLNAGDMTMRTSNAKLGPTETLDMSAADSARLGVADGVQVRVCSKYGTIKIKACVTAAVGLDRLCATFHDVRVGLNRLTRPFRDNLVQAPEYKVTAVRVEPLGR